jgi:hydroxymethylbilane synthase
MLRIATRQSDLALWQARSVQRLLESHGHTASELVYIATRGDLDQGSPFNTLDGRGFFTKELENSLLEGRTDLAVHSLKDLPTTAVPGLHVEAVLSRADRRDVLLARREARDSRSPLPLRHGARLGTSSVRRRAQAALWAPDLQILELRGNVPTRVRKLREGQYDAILLAKAGLDRLELDLSDLDVTVLPLEAFLPAPGQAALAIEIRSGDLRTQAAVHALDDARVRLEIEAERGLLNRFAGGCNLPLGAYADCDDGVVLHAFYAAFDREGRPHAFRSTRRESTSEEAAEAAFADLLEQKSRWARSERALSGLTVAVTRPATAVAGLREAVEAMGGTLLPVPTLAFEPTASDLPVAANRLWERYDWLLFTSQNAVHFFTRMCAQKPTGLKVGAVGRATAGELTSAGWTVDLVGSGQGGGDFALQFLTEVGPARRVLWPTGETHRTELPDALIARGVTVEPWRIYRSVAPPEVDRVPRSDVRPDWILVTSPEAGRRFVDLYGRPEGARWAAMGPTSQQAMQELLGQPVTVAREASLEALAEVLV